MICGQIVYDEEAGRLRLNGRKLHCGMTLDIAILDPDFRWVSSKLTWDGKWVFQGLEQYSAAGLFAKTDDPYFEDNRTLSF